MGSRYGYKTIEEKRKLERNVHINKGKEEADKSWIQNYRGKEEADIKCVQK
jgi:hypothetical protein